jgi:serine/threonine protein kinase
MKKKEYGQLLVLPPYKGRILSEYYLPQFIQAISDCQRLLDDPTTEILLDSRNRVGAVVIPLSEKEKADVVIKEFRTRGVNRLKSLFVRGKALKSWQGGMALAEKGIDTPPPVAYLEKRRGLFLGRSFFLTERVYGMEEIRFLFRSLPSPELDELLTSLSQHLFLCHCRGILHRDLSNGNILVKKDESGIFRFFLLDTNRVRIKNRIGRLRGLKNLIRLGVPSEHQRYFLEQYLGEVRLTGWVWFWYRFNKLIYSSYVELKKKLRLRQIARKLKIQ